MSEEYFVDIAYRSINKDGEELCGDKVEIIREDNRNMIVMADGLGSGVKANILSTLTSKIVISMLEGGINIYETVDTVIHTLPVCKVRKLAYSTFTIAEIFEDGRTYIAEYDNPPIFLIRDGKLVDLKRRETQISNTVVRECNLTLQKNDLLAIVSDGVVHAGVGGILNLGWQWKNVGEYLCKVALKEKSAGKISKALIDTCEYLYGDKPGDDTTVVIAKVRKPEIVDLFTGPPKDSSNDAKTVENLMNGKGKKVVCGGTAAKIVARELGREIITNMDFIDPEVPPTAEIEGIDLVTEGVLTLSKAVEKIKRYINSPYKDNLFYSFNKNDGASKLVRLLIEDCTHLNLWVGKAINPAHQNPDFPADLSIKLKVVQELVAEMKALGTKVNVIYV